MFVEGPQVGKHTSASPYGRVESGLFHLHVWTVCKLLFSVASSTLICCLGINYTSWLLEPRYPSLNISAK